MARLGVSKKKKSPRATELSQLKKELQRVTEQLESYKRELAEAKERETATGEILRVIASSPTDIQRVLDVVAEKCCTAVWRGRRSSPSPRWQHASVGGVVRVSCDAEGAAHEPWLYRRPSRNRPANDPHPRHYQGAC